MVKTQKIIATIFILVSCVNATIEVDLSPGHESVGDGIYLKSGGIHTNSLGVRLTKGSMPYVGRMVRFVSRDTNILVFEEGKESIVVETDEDGYAMPVFRLMQEGKAFVNVYELSSRSTNYIVHEDAVRVYSYSLTTRILKLTLINLLVIVISTFLIAHFKRLKKKTEKPTIARRGMSTLFGLDQISSKKYLIPIIVLLESILMLYLLNTQSVMLFTIFLSLCALSAYSIRHDRGYAFFFIFFALLGATYFYSNSLISELLYKTHRVEKILLNPVVAFGAFFLLTAFMNGNYFVYLLLVFYTAILTPSNFTVGVILSAVFLSDMLYLILSGFNIKPFIFYKINFLRLEE